MDVATWLRGLGLEQYAPAFHDNAVDGEILRELTADDLKDLGVALVGHRRKLLAAIVALGTEPPIVAQLATSARDRCSHLTSDNRRRTPTADDDVLRSRGLDRALDPS